jgi:cyclic pyranopterin phosphate synthase
MRALKEPKNPKDRLVNLKRRTKGHPDHADTGEKRRGGVGILDRYTLRVSVTDRCQLRCDYCVPDSVKHTPHYLLSPEDHGRMAQLLADLPIAKVRYTGGEPLLRRDLPEIITAWKDALPQASLGVTTNGQLLTKRADALHEAGISMATIHLDTLRPDRYSDLMGEGDLEHALAAIDASLARGWLTKINVVVQRGRNDDELIHFLDFSRRRKVEVRFIEMMNTGSAEGFVAEHFINGAEIIGRIAGEVGVKPAARRHPSDPASLFEIPDDGLRFGLIASDTQPFCEACDRLRITAKGELRGCLYAPGGYSLLNSIHDQADTVLEKERILDAIGKKKSHHPDHDEERVNFSMAGVGG